MSRKELSRYLKRLVVLEERGCRIRLQLYSGRRGRPAESTPSALLARQPYSSEQFSRELDRFRNGSTSSNDIYGLRSTLEFLSQIKALVVEVKRRQLDRKVVATIAPFFPEKASVNISIPVFFVALGNENAAAFVRSVEWRDNIPYFVGDGEGELTIVVNLTRSVQYIHDIQIQFVDMMSTLAHETFHAVFGVYKQSSPVWRTIEHQQEPYWTLAELSQNEGIAYLISLQQRSGSALSAGQLSSSKQAVESLNNALKELSSPSISPSRANFAS